jgi:hypothetical protein
MRCAARPTMRATTPAHTAVDPLNTPNRPAYPRPMEPVEAYGSAAM